MSFLENLDQYGEGITAPRNSLAIDPRTRFVAAAREQIKLLQSGNTPKTLWFSEIGSALTGGPVWTVTLRNGVAIIVLQKVPKRAFKSQEAAIGYLEAAIEAALTGELDDVLAETQLKRGGA